MKGRKTDQSKTSQKKKLLTDNTDKHFSGHWDLEK